LLKADVARFLMACPTAAVAIGPDDQILFVNQPAKDLLGLNRAPGVRVFTEFVPQWTSLGTVFRASVKSRSGQALECDISVTPGLGDKGEISVALVSVHRSTERALEEANLRLKYVIEMLPQAVCVFDANDRYVLWNKKYAELYSEIADHLSQGIPFAEILEISLESGDMIEVVSDRDEWLRQRMEKFHRPASQEEQQLRDGRWLRHDDRRTPDGGAIGMRIDITELKQREIWLRELFEANPMPMLLCDGEDFSILQVNTAAADLFGLSRSELIENTPLDLIAQEQRSEFATVLGGLLEHSNARKVWRHQTACGRQIHVLIYVRRVYEVSSRRLLLTIADVSDRILAEEEATRLAHHDLLTGLPNRVQFYKALEEAFSSDDKEAIVVYCLDLDGFKPVNDTFGHAAGDDVLKEVAQRLRDQQGKFMVARLGGDEFAILFRTTGAAKTDLADQCLAAFERPFEVKGISIRIGVSIGIASTPNDGLNGEALIQAADRALYVAKEAGRGTWKLASDEPHRGVTPNSRAEKGAQERFSQRPYRPSFVPSR